MVNNQINAVQLQTSSTNIDAKTAARAKLMEKINGAAPEEKAVQTAPSPSATKDVEKIAEIKATLEKLDKLLADDPENEKLISIRDAWQEKLIELDPPKDRFKKFTADGKEIVWDKEKKIITYDGIIYTEDEMMDMRDLDKENSDKLITLKSTFNLRPVNIPWEEPSKLQNARFKG